MTATSQLGSAQAGGSRGAPRRWVWWVLGAVALTVVALVGGAPRHEGTPLDPDGTGPQGLKAVRELLGSFGARVDVTSDLTSTVDVAFLPQDVVAPEDAEAVDSWVDAGGILVVADPHSQFAPPVGGSTGFFGGLVDPTIPRGECDVDALRALDRLGTGGNGVRFRVPEGSQGCFTQDGDAFVTVTPQGRGAIVAVGSVGPFLNAHLGEEDNAALAVDLMAPHPGTRTVFLEAGDGGVVDQRSLTDAISPGVRLGLLQLILAFIVYAWYRARRLGKPITEPQPVQIAGSELVSAVGNLLQQTKSPERAAELLRRDLRARLAERLGLPREATPELVADVCAQRVGTDRDQVLVAVGDAPVTTDAELLALARTIDSIRKEVLHGT